MEFYQTGYGKRFFEVQLPKLIDALNDVAAALQAPFVNPEIQVDTRPALLRDFYNGYFQPGEDAGETKTQRYRELTQQLESIRGKLKNQINPEDWALVQEYTQTFAERCAEELDITFESGYRTATQLLLAGLSRGK